MSGLESLKSLTVKSPSIWGPTARVPWQDVCIAMSATSREASKYGRLKYCMEHRCRKEVLMNLYSSALKLKWNKGIKRTDIGNIIRLALDESISPSICPKCNGRKELIVFDSIYKCDVCLGVGTRSMSDRSRARYIYGTDDHHNTILSRFHRTVKYNYFNTLISTIQEWEMELHRAFKRMR